MSFKPRKSFYHLLSFFTKSFAKPEPHTGLVWIVLGASDVDSSYSDLDALVNETLVPSLQYEEGISLLYRLHNTNPSARNGTLRSQFRPTNGGRCALVLEIANSHDTDTLKALSNLPIIIRPGLSLPRYNEAEREETGHGTGIMTGYGAYLKRYDLVQRFENPRHLAQSIGGTCIVAVAIEPADGDDDMLDQWYRDEHLNLLAQIPIFVRCSRFKLLSPEQGQVVDDGTPRFLALHEYEGSKALLDYAIQHGQIVPETATSKLILDRAKKIERRVWDVRERWDGSDAVKYATDRDEE